MHIVVAAVVATVVTGFLLLVDRRRRRAEGGRIRRQRAASWGRPLDGGEERPSFEAYRRHRASQGVRSIDDRTWQDLALADVFTFIDRCESALGRGRLHDRLRGLGHTRDSLAAFDHLVDRIQRDDTLRLDLQQHLAALNVRGVGDAAWPFGFDSLASLPPWTRAFPIFAVSMLVMSGLTPLLLPVLSGPLVGLLAVAILVGVGVMRVASGRLARPLVIPCRAAVRLVAVARRLSRLDLPCPEIRAALAAHLPALRHFARLAGLLSRDITTMGLIEGCVREYLNLMVCLDGNLLILARRAVAERAADLMALAEAVGELDAAVSVASVRAGGRWTRPVFREPGASFEVIDARHPLIERPVGNDLTLGPPDGLIVTGANMTGKSTFLRTIGLNAVLAQSLFTVWAERYEVPWVEVRSCIGATDDLLRGKSYYQAEVEAVVSIVARAGQSGTMLCLFDELFRGTNTTDRVAAGTAVLMYLMTTSARCLVVAATHDRDLVQALHPHYAPYHFGDLLGPEGLIFDYRLRPGPATSRNAIALLGVLGAPPALVADALARSHRQSLPE